MKALRIFLIIVLAVAAVFFFTKPTDDECLAKAKPTVDAKGLSITPGYDSPSDEGTAGITSADAFQVNDKFFYKEVACTVKGETKTIGYGYLGSFHPAEKEKKEDK